MAYSAPALTRAKLLAMQHVFSSDWHWPVLAADVTIVMALLIYIPILLVRTAYARPAMLVMLRSRADDEGLTDG